MLARHLRQVTAALMLVALAGCSGTEASAPPTAGQETPPARSAAPHAADFGQLERRFDARLGVYAVDAATREAEVPGDGEAGDKSGKADHGTRNDIGVVRPPDRAPIVLAVMSDRKGTWAPTPRTRSSRTQPESPSVPSTDLPPDWSSPELLNP